ncbi:Uncharacterised protein [Mycobacteroides abscessus subsp. abscessus]|uniref:Uncharacterized protein n=2 Tax=Mycobacteroides abscessus TaxID=36809 RepID=A0AB38CVB3_9MYCO|nr:Uncharacterised protein [Mycobacteroides abscessus]SHP43685.1 Uncharacterised protein [Mycobacteroides abscessus subsp. abscessus]SKM03107.1 Uncharacterised protein [Mycobacteroides abscessus subsp. massiliense]SLD43417.1 Uncharacterised protein [Mycobacteroides abscessus subsp. bolletii]CPS05498.1 Uncharacterised protein [Mycobacteroides abscessus]
MTEIGLFEVPDDAYVVPPLPEQSTASERRKRLIQTRIARGEHPLGKSIRLHDQAARVRGGEGLKCGDCVYRVMRRWPKCLIPLEAGGRVTYPRETGSESSDVRAWWPACAGFKARDEE